MTWARGVRRARAALAIGAALMASSASDARGAPPEQQDASPSVASRNPIPGQRIRITLNDGWRYADDDRQDAAAPSHDDRDWTRVAVPHTWNREDGASESLGYRRGIGWYRRALTLDSALAGRRLFLHFEGANQVADVWVNGTHAGQHIGGYTAFTFDVTELVRFDAPNVIAVRVNNAHDPDIPPLNADFTFYGGIYRDVWLVATAPVHITMLDHGSPGMFIETPAVSAREATVRIRGTVVNSTGAARRVRVTHRVVGPDGREAAALSASLHVPARGSAKFDQASRPIAAPRLWSPDDPALYRVVTEVADGATVVDRVENPLGFRWISVDAQRGFMLNGRRLDLHGTNRHQDREGYGNAVPDWVHREDVRLVKANGFDFLRLAHYPQDPVVLDETDRLGIVVWEEIPVVNLITMSEAFADNSERMLVEMIRQHFNHPSVVMWGYMNEVMLSKPNPVPPGYYERIVQLGRRLDARAKAEDATRPTVTAISFEEIDNGTGFQDIPDILGLNLYFGWYYRTLEGLGPWLDSLHARHPSRPLIISEYGADSDERIHTTAGRAFDFSAEYQQRFHEETFPQLAERDWLAGTAVWNQFDFGVKGRHDSKPNVNQKGLFYYDRAPKDIAFYYRARLTSEPVLHLATRDDATRAGSTEADRVQPVKVYSSLGAVELLHDGRSLGVRRPDNSTAEWTVRLADGDNRFTARGAEGGRAIEDEAVVRYTDRSAFFRDAGSEVRTFALNAGSHYGFVDPAGVVWAADAPAPGAGWSRSGGTPQLIHHRIFGTPDHPLYQSALEGVERYRFDVPDGTYDVVVRLTEIRHQAAGERVFDVRVNDQALFTRLDLAAQYGRYVAVERTMRADARDGSGIEIRFVPLAGQPIVSGILIRRQ